jgi:hypothetical protein
MQRVVALFALIMCAGLVAGCGGSALQAKARKVVGDPHATVVSTETVDPLGGGRVAVVVMRPGGSQGLGCAIAQSGSSNSPASGCPRWSDAYVLLNPTTHADGGDLGISRFQVAAIARARATSPRFQMFPSVNQLAVRCAIPHASPSGGRLSGACLTTALPFGSPVRCVAFSEAWRPSAGSKLRTRGWIVMFNQNGQVQSTRGATHPPQRDGHQPNTCSAI